MDDSSRYDNFFDDCLTNFGYVLKRHCDKHLTLNWQKCYFTVKRAIALGHSISHEGIEVDKEKVDLISNLSLPTCVKVVRFFLGHVDFYWRFIRDFSAIPKALPSVLAKDKLFHFSKECYSTFSKFKVVFMCDVFDYAVGGILG